MALMIPLRRKDFISLHLSVVAFGDGQAEYRYYNR